MYCHHYHREEYRLNSVPLPMAWDSKTDIDWALRCRGLLGQVETKGGCKPAGAGRVEAKHRGVACLSSCIKKTKPVPSWKHWCGSHRSRAFAQRISCSPAPQPLMGYSTGGWGDEGCIKCGGHCLAPSALAPRHLQHASVQSTPDQTP